MLGGDKDGVHADGLDALFGGFVLDRYLDLAVGAQPWDNFFAAAFLQPIDELVGEGVG